MFSGQPFSTPSALAETFATAFYLTTIGQTSAGGATSSHSTTAYLSSRRHLGSTILGLSLQMLATLELVAGNSFTLHSQDPSFADHEHHYHSPRMSCQMFRIQNRHLTSSLFSADVNQPPPIQFPATLTAANLASLVSQIQAQAYAPGTLRNLRSQGRLFMDFCRTYNFTPVPASPHVLASYACYLSRKTSSYQYILNHLNTVRLLHRYNGCATDALDSFEVSLTKRGLRRLLGTATHQKHPITPTILLEIRHHLDTSLPFHSAIWAFFCTAFFSSPGNQT